MDFEAFDWDAEAQRVARAFGIEAPLRFRLKTKRGHERRDLLMGSHTNIVVHENLRLCVISQSGTMYFKLHHEGVASWVTVTHGGDLCQFGLEAKYAEPLLKGLFHLGLLKPITEFSFEEYLGVSISAHQKLEWQLEYEERYGL